MWILRRYFIKEFIKFLLIFLVSFTALSIVAEFFDKANEFYSKKAPLYVVIQYLLLQSPGVMLYALPFAILFSILITIGIASKWREVIIIRASGGSTKTFFANFLVIGVVFTLLALLLGETIVPDMTRKAALLRKVEILKESPKIEYKEEALWLKGLDKSLIRIDGFIADKNKVLRTSIFTFSSYFGLEERIEAEEAEWKNGTWELKNVRVFDFRNNTTKRYKTLVSNAIDEPKIFREEMRKPEEMNFAELYTYYHRLEKSGFRNLKYAVSLYEKLSYPAINFIMVLFGISLALNSRWGGGIKAAGFGVIVSIMYWIIYSTGISLGNIGVLPPWFAPWICPLIFGITGSLMYRNIQE
ncbi:MAG TPA: LPS export ABC transporter permease LptG [Thermodesulfobacteriota bacterium]|nr:LPS export ABC transporter permease LptG [Thermodesulfobacteriota bacterium]